MKIKRFVLCVIEYKKKIEKLTKNKQFTYISSF